MGNCTTLIENQSHLGSPSNANVINRVKDLLIANPASISFCTGGFLPKPLNGALSLKEALLKPTSQTESIRITSFMQGSHITGARSMSIAINGNNLTEIILLVDHNKDTLYAAKTSGDSATFSLVVDGSYPGRKSIVALGKTESGNWVVDSTYFIVTDIPTTSDLTPTLYARPSVTSNTTPVTVVVDVIELLSLPTSGTITVRVTKDPRISLSCPPSATSINGRSVQNPVWTFDDTSSPDYYILTTTQPIAAGEMLSFGMTGTLSPGATTGVLSLSAVVMGGGEVKVTNNTDADKIDYY